MKFGYVKKDDNATLKFRNYMGPALPPPPVAVDWSLAISEDLGMMGNDQVGDCTCADVGHTVMLLTAMGAGIVVPTTAEVLALYSGATGYDPNDPSTDQGASLTEIADYVQKNGLVVGGKPHKIHAYIDIDITSVEQFKQSIYLFKHASIGFSVPKSAMPANPADIGKNIWKDYSGPFVGQHDVPLVKFDDEGPTAITWGASQKMTWDFLLHLVVEGQARLYDDAAGPDWNDANGFSFSQLEQDLAALG
jgi:hypothetical protein